MPATVSEEEKKALIDRLARIEGQLRGVQRMIAEEKPCEAIAQQLAAARGALNKAFAERLPDFVDAEVVSTVSGAYDITPDFHPILGWAPELEGLYLATGFSGHGLKLSPAVGECVAATVLDKQPPFDITPLRPSRFAEGKPMYLAYGPSARA